LAFIAMPFAVRLGTEIPSRLFLKDAYRFARSFHCPSPEGAVRRVDSSHGVHRVCPFVDIGSARPLPLAETSFGGKVPPFPHVPSLPFLPASTVYSARRPASLLHLAADRGVRPVSGPGAEARRAVLVGGTPFEAFPSPAASSRHRCSPEGVRCSPRVVPSRRWSWLPRRLRVATPVVCRPGPRPQGFAPPKSPLQTIGVATSRRPMLPWAYWSDTVRGSRTVAGQQAAGRSTPEGEKRHRGCLRAASHSWAVVRTKSELPPACSKLRVGDHRPARCTQGARSRSVGCGLEGATPAAPRGFGVGRQSAWARQQAGGLRLVRGRAAVSVDPPSGVSEEALSGRALLPPRPFAARLLPGWLRTTLSDVRARLSRRVGARGRRGPRLFHRCPRASASSAAAVHPRVSSLRLGPPPRRWPDVRT
jgi:hypothetical protein